MAELPSGASGFRRWIWSARYAIRLPSRIVLLVLVAGGFAATATLGDTRPEDAHGLTYVLLVIGGMAMFVVLVGWRWFWYGPAVQAVWRKSSSGNSSSAHSVEARSDRTVPQGVAVSSGGESVKGNTAGPDRSKCPCGCGRDVRSSLRDLYDVTLQTAAMPELIDRFKAMPNADLSGADKYARHTAALHSRLVAWCHQEGPSGARAGAALGADCRKWRETMDTILAAVATTEPEFALDWTARAAGIVAEGWHPDPLGRSVLRYFDGQHWTGYLSDGRSTQVDDAW